MNQRLLRIIGGIIVLLVLIVIIVLVNDNSANQQENLKNPALFTSYLNSGYYKIDPEIILASLETGKTEVFTPLLENPDEIQPVTNMPVRWTQADFLKIASAFGQFAWGDPMSLKDWSVHFIDFEGSCDLPMGFNFASITYFKPMTTGYETRLIEIDPNFGWVRWGNGQTYPKPILRSWNRVGLLDAKISADKALEIASEDAKKRFQFKDGCGVSMSAPQDDNPVNWYLKFIGASDAIAYSVNLDTGDYALQK